MAGMYAVQSKWLFKMHLYRLIKNNGVVVLAPSDAARGA